MALLDKYKQLIEKANVDVSNIQVKEENGVLYIDGDATGKAKQELWDLYGNIDPDYSSGDLILNINSIAGVEPGAKLKVTTASTNLNIRAGAGTDTAIIGKAGRGEIVTLVRKENDQWWVIKNQKGVEGFAYTQYLAAI